jgi:Cyclin D1 binding domain
VRDNVVIQPGLFNGTYGDHGIELVLLTYDDQGHHAMVTKITVC